TRWWDRSFCWPSSSSSTTSPSATPGAGTRRPPSSTRSPGRRCGSSPRSVKTPFGGTRHSYHLGEISPVHYVCPLDYWIYARREGEPRVLVVEGYQIDHLMPREPGDLRNRNLLSFNPHEIARLEVTLGAATYTAVRTPEGWTVEG